jgi:hypothetical protein
MRGTAQRQVELYPAKMTEFPGLNPRNVTQITAGATPGWAAGGRKACWTEDGRRPEVPA